MGHNQNVIIKDKNPNVLRDMGSKESKGQNTTKGQLPIFKKPKGDMKNVSKLSFNSRPQIEAIDITSLITKFNKDSDVMDFNKLSSKWLEFDEHVPRNMSDLPNSFSLFEFLMGEVMFKKLKEWADLEYPTINPESKKVLTMIVAFSQRVTKFKIKLFCVQTMLHCAPQNSITITKKCENILYLLK